MATKGRKPLPTALKLLEGDRGKGRRPINKEEPAPPQDHVKCPSWLMPEAKKEWKRLAPSLIAMGVLTDHDMEVRLKSFDLLIFLSQVSENRPAF